MTNIEDLNQTAYISDTFWSGLFVQDSQYILQNVLSFQYESIKFPW